MQMFGIVKQLEITRNIDLKNIFDSLGEKETPQRANFNTKTSQLSMSLQIYKELVLRKRQEEDGGRN